MSDDLPILRPRPQRPGFELTPSASNESSEAPTPAEPANPDFLNPRDAGTPNVSRNGSIMNLTSSTLFGIYSPTAFEGSRDESSPWGTEAQSPATENVPTTEAKPDANRFKLERSRSRLSHGLFRGVILPRAFRGALLFAFGVVYGVITVHLHDNHWITPVKLENLHYYDSWQYLGFWGVAGVVMGNVLPWLDLFVEDSDSVSAAVGGRGGKEVKSSPGADGNEEDRTPPWVAIVRSVGAFVGIAFAMVSYTCRLLCIVSFGSLTGCLSTEETSLAIHHPSLGNARPREPRPVVSHRSHQNGVRPVDGCRSRRDVRDPGSAAGTGAVFARPDGTLGTERDQRGICPEQRNHSGGHCSYYMDIERPLLRLRVLWQHRPPAGYGRRAEGITQVVNQTARSSRSRMRLLFAY